MATATQCKSITCQKLAELAGADQIELIDVRMPVEFRELHCVHARNVPLDSLDPTAIMEARSDKNAPLYVICRTGNRSSRACDAFLAAGYSNVVNVEGGTLAWDEAGLPVLRGKKAISLERQVRIAAGFLVFIGTVFGVFHDEYWLGIPAFVGAGLMFAGITDTCGMAMLLAKMPWNQVKGTCTLPLAGDSAEAPSSGGCCG